MKTSCFTLLLMSLCLSVPAGAQDGVYTDPADVDEDYAFQGEYRGWLRSRPSARSSEPLGLQVVALGKGKFNAVTYYGGLPGAGWYGQGTRVELSGERQGDLLHLIGPQYRFEIDGNRALVYTSDGREAGWLQKTFRVSPTMGAAPPPGAIVLFDGTHTDLLKNGKIDDDGLLMKGAETLEAYGDFRMHLEFRTPYQPHARGQGRGNSGVYIQSRYEVQILDSFGLEGIENECGSLYRTRRPDINMCLPPLVWQTYDIDFTGPKFDEEGNKISNMRISVWQNGILVQNHAEILDKTGAGRPEGPQPLPTKFQDHKDPVVFRNIWLIPKQPSTRPSADWVQAVLHLPPTPLVTRSTHRR